MSITPEGPPPVDLKAGFTRKVRCPRCAAEFETPKRWDLDCPHCGHEWQEVSVQNRSEKLAQGFGDLADRLFKPVMLLIAFGIVIGMAGLVVFSVAALLGQKSGATTVEIIVFVAVFFGIAAIFGMRPRLGGAGWFSPSGFTSHLLWSWVARWRPRDDEPRPVTPKRKD
ncbi:MAG TPA: hypothetical protein VI876_06115 [Dehalococcoidia bacterium]|nr:hypothetical protein [Dehalococcoidia bacterium]